MNGIGVFLGTNYAGTDLLLNHIDYLATLAAVAETLALVRSRTTFPPVRAGTAC